MSYKILVSSSQYFLIRNKTETVMFFFENIETLLFAYVLSHYVQDLCSYRYRIQIHKRILHVDYVEQVQKKALKRFYFNKM